MSLRTALQIVLGAAFVISLGSLVLRHVKPLVPAPALQVTYSAEGEDFRKDGRAYRPFYRQNIFYLHLPKAAPDDRWWVVNFTTLMVYRPQVPVRIGLLRFVRREAAPPVPLSDETVFRGWLWQFTQDGLSFAGNGITCRVRRR